MANIEELKIVGEKLVPIFKDLFNLIKTDAEKPDKQPEKEVIQHLKKLIAEAIEPTPASQGQRFETISAARTTLTEIIIQAAGSNHQLRDTTIRTIKTQRNSLQNAIGLLGQRSVFEPIPRLLTDKQIEQISVHLDGADAEIAQHQKAKKILDTTIRIAITAARIAVKLA